MGRSNQFDRNVHFQGVLVVNRIFLRVHKMCFGPKWSITQWPARVLILRTDKISRCTLFPSCARVWFSICGPGGVCACVPSTVLSFDMSTRTFAFRKNKDTGGRLSTRKPKNKEWCLRAWHEHWDAWILGGTCQVATVGCKKLHFQVSILVVVRKLSLSLLASNPSLLPLSF